MKEDEIRAKLISSLWSLKTAISKNPDGIEGLSYINFNNLIRDETYRLTVLQAASHSAVPEISTLADKCLQLNLSGSLTWASGSQSAITVATANSMTHAVEEDSEQKKRLPFALLVLISIVIIFGSITTAVSGWLWGASSKVISGSITESQIWHADTHYILSGLVFVESGATLNIEAGTKISGKSGSALIVTRDASINAQGRKDAPIIMSSVQPEGSRHRGDWGGLVLLGNAPVNTGTGHIEGVDKNDPRGGFGGSADTDSCGVLKYVRIEFAGYEISQDNELNGLTLGGCGSGTLLSHIQVHMGLDDGIEFFGGSANLKYVLISRPGDDGLDWDRGWQGHGQFIIIHQGPDEGDNGIEADNYKKDKNALPRSMPSLSNVTIVGSDNPNIAQRGLLLRHGTAGDLRNFLITGFTTEALDIRGTETVKLIASNELSASGWLIENSSNQFFSDEKGEKDDDNSFSEALWIKSHNNLLTNKPALVIPDSPNQVPNFTPSAKSLATQVHSPIPQGEFWNEGANYAGAIRPGERISWLDGWTAYPVN